jgi:hypothetical protein
MADEGVQLMPDSLLDSPGGDDAPVDSYQQAGAAEPTTDGTTGSPESGIQPSGDTKEDKTGKRIADTEEKLRELQRELHKTAVERARLEGEVSALRVATAPKQEAPTDYLGDESWDEKFAADPAGAYREAMKRERAQMAAILDDRDRMWREEMRRVVEQTTDPERAGLRDEMGELKTSVAGWENLPDETQLSMAKALRNRRPAQTLRPPASSPGGSGNRAPTPDQRKQRDADAEARRLALFGQLAAADDAQYPMGKPQSVGA